MHICSLLGLSLGDDKEAVGDQEKHLDGASLCQSAVRILNEPNPKGKVSNYYMYVKQ